MVEPVSAVLTGIALVTKSVEFVKKNISTCQDIGELIGHVENAFEGQKKVIKEREKSGADPFSTQEVAKEVINARLAQEQLYEMKQLINLRFGHGTWEYILEERKKRIDKRKKAIKEARAKAHKKQQEIIEYVKWGFITIATVAFIGVSVGVTLKFFVTLSSPVYAHEVEHDDGSCLIYLPKYYLMCINESRELADTQVYLDYLNNRRQWIEIETNK